MDMDLLKMDANPLENAKTFLTDENVRMLKELFPNEETYIKHMKTLWVLRALSYDMYSQSGQGTQDPNFRIFDLMNKLIGALLHDGIFFEFDGKNVYHYKNK